MTEKATLAAKHFDALFGEATSRLREVRVGDPQSQKSTVQAIATAQDITLDTLNSLDSNPHFGRLLSFLQSQEKGADNVLLERDATAQYDRVLAASLKVMLREAMFAKTGAQRDSYLSRVSSWYDEKSGGGGGGGGVRATVPSSRGPESNDDERVGGKRNNMSNNNTSSTASLAYDDIPVDDEDDDEVAATRIRSDPARAARYATRGPNWQQQRPKSAVNNVFLSGTVAGADHEKAMEQAQMLGTTPIHSVLGAQRGGRPSSAAPTTTAAGRRAGQQQQQQKRPQTTSSGGSERDGVVITGRLNQGGFKVRNLFASQRNRIGTNILSRGAKRKALHQVKRGKGRDIFITFKCHKWYIVLYISLFSCISCFLFCFSFVSLLSSLIFFFFITNTQQRKHYIVLMYVKVVVPINIY